MGPIAPPPHPGGTGPHHSRVFCITHSDAPHSVGLLWTSDRLVAETSTRQHTTLTNRQTSLPQAGFKPTIPASERPQTYALDRAVTGIGNFTVPVYYILRKIRVKNMGRCSSVIIVIRLRSGHHRNRNSIADSGKGLFSSPSFSDRFWFPRSLLSNVYRGRFSGSKAAAA